jgi:MFS family permease
MTALQEVTPRGYQARVTGLLESLGAAMPGAGYVLGGVLAAIGSPRTAFAVAGAGVLVLAAVGAVARPRFAARPDPAARPMPAERPLPDPLSPARSLEHERG